MTSYIHFASYVPVLCTFLCPGLSPAAERATTPCNTIRMDSMKTDMPLLLPPVVQKPAAQTRRHVPVQILPSSTPPAPSLARAPGTATVPGQDHRLHVSDATLR